MENAKPFLLKFFSKNVATMLVALPEEYEHITPVIEAIITSEGGVLVSRWSMPFLSDRVIVKDSFLKLPEFRVWKMNDIYVLTGDVIPGTPYEIRILAEILGEKLGKMDTVIGVVFAGENSYPGKGINALITLYARKNGAKTNWVVANPYNLREILAILHNKEIPSRVFKKISQHFPGMEFIR